MPIVRLSELTPTTVDWLWPGWLATGALHVLDGDPGVGKSMLTADIAARISTGRPWPDHPRPDRASAAGSNPADAHSIFLLNAEDDPESTTMSRLAAFGADLDRIHAWTFHGDDCPPLLPNRIDTLRDAIDRFRPRLVVLDPITAFLDRSVAFHHDPAIRQALRPLAKLAAERRCAILLIRHLTKRPGQRSLYRGLGSIGVVASCRIAWLAAADPDLPNRCVLSVHKTNFAAAPGSLAYSLAPRIECTHLAPRDDSVISRSEMSTLPLTWLGPAPSAASELLDPRRLTPRDRARRLLADLLKDGPRTSPELHAATARHHVKWRTLRRAAKDLHVDIRTIGNQFVGKTAYWLLPGQRIPASALEPGSVDEWLERLQDSNRAFLESRELDTL